MTEDTISLPAIEIQQGTYRFYVSCIEAHDLAAMRRTDELRLTTLNVPTYEGYQRAIDQARVLEIKQFLEAGGTLPGSIIVNANSANIENWLEAKATSKQAGARITILRLRRLPDSLSVIDGQHRAAALESAERGYRIPITLFVDLELVKCAEIFRVINQNQRKVNPSIAFQLFGYSDKQSPQKTAHEVAKSLNDAEGSPFRQRLKMLGYKDRYTAGTLSQATFARELLPFYSKNAKSDETEFLKGDTPGNDGTPMRELFLNNDSRAIADILWNYFAAFATVFPDDWNSKKSILTRSTGYVALMHALKLWCAHGPFSELNDYESCKDRAERLRPLVEEGLFQAKNYAGSGYKEAHALGATIAKALGIPLTERRDTAITA